MNVIQKYQFLLEKTNHSYWEKRILSQIAFMLKVSEVKEHRFDEVLEQGLDQLTAALEKEGVISDQAARKVEEELSVLSPEAKKYKVICTAHAHIDMNWMWGFQETVAVTIDTFRTMLKLLKEYPEFTFSQSQASTYRIIEQYYPEMLPEIKQRIHEGRWEVTASTWVECDKNMPNGESLSRQVLYTKKYLSKLLEIPEESMELDFEPDTFGHSANVPEILTNGNVKYLYHCRGYMGHHVYRWKAPSGAEVLAYREPYWYNADIEYDMLLNVPEFCQKHNIDIMLKVYGVGDHGGGPTRRDIEILRDMTSWPLQPKLEFGTYHQFFHELEQYADRLPVVEQELNFVFSGCYTAQSRIKMANRLGEDRLYDAEMLCTLAGLKENSNRFTERFQSAWEKHLFDQFHDIIPGSGVLETREHALGNFQEIMAYANSNANQAMYTLMERIDTSGIVTGEDPLTRSEGAGVGFNVSDADPSSTGHISEADSGLIRRCQYKFPQAERGNGKVRILHAFNTTQYDRKEVVEFVIWDWNGKEELLAFEDIHGNRIPVQILENQEWYWMHHYIKFVAEIEVPAFGYCTYVVKEAQPQRIVVPDFVEPRIDVVTSDNLVLENEHLRAEFEQSTMQLVSLVNKADGTEMLSKPAGYFQYALETTHESYIAWRIGRFMQIVNLNEVYPVCINTVSKGELVQTIQYDLTFMQSKLSVAVSLEKNSKMLKFFASADWTETGDKQKGMPNLSFMVPVGYQANKFTYDIPGGMIVRPAIGHDVPGNSLIHAVNPVGPSLALITDNKYGYRGTENTMAVTLLHTSYEPDRYPEFGIHDTTIALAVTQTGSDNELLELSSQIAHPVHTLSNTSHAGDLPLEDSFLTVEGNVKVSAVKMPEDKTQNQVILRFYHTGEDATDAAFHFAGYRVKSAQTTDLLEHPKEELPVDGDTVTVTVQPDTMRTICVTLEQ